jgi:hypothetical protein
MRLRREVADELGADGQQQRPGELGHLPSHDLVLMAVAGRWPASVRRRRHGCGSKPALRTAASAGAMARLVGIDGEHPLAQLEAQAAHMPGTGIERVRRISASSAAQSIVAIAETAPPR